ncbi:MAG: hypothetical protein HYV63_17870 [Candidatus Schekmanbacteria bacterium]|nr:hypothetical protein [Candidatus Schekmanbacteria bacterium]
MSSGQARHDEAEHSRGPGATGKKSATAEAPKTVVSAPGKLILMGDHAAVYNRPALVATVDLRLQATFSPRADGGLHIELPQLALTQEVTWPELMRHCRSTRDRWNAYVHEPTPERFAVVRGSDPAHAVKIALGEAALFLGEEQGPGLSVRVDSELPVGAGFGSSAAMAVALSGGYLVHRGLDLDINRVGRIALDVERRQHGFPSGVDHTTILLGGIVWAQREALHTVAAERIQAASPVLGKIRIYNTGCPAETTGTVVAAVRQRATENPELMENTLERMREDVVALREELERRAENSETMLELIRDYEACLETIGVVPRPVQELIREIERRGGAAKVSGAGALTGAAAGSMIVYHPDPAEVDAWGFLSACQRYEVSIGADGLRKETR